MPIHRQFKAQIDTLHTYLSFVDTHFKRRGINVSITAQDIGTMIEKMYNQKINEEDCSFNFDETILAFCVYDALIHLANQANDYIGIQDVEQYLLKKAMWPVPPNMTAKYILSIYHSRKEDIDVNPDNCFFVRLNHNGCANYTELFSCIDPSKLIV